MGHGVCQDHAHLFLARAPGRARALRQRVSVHHRRARRQPRLGRHLAAGRGLDQRGHPTASSPRNAIAGWPWRATDSARRCAACAMAAARSPCRCRPRRSADPACTRAAPLRRGFSPAPIMTLLRRRPPERRPGFPVRLPHQRGGGPDQRLPQDDRLRTPRRTRDGPDDRRQPGRPPGRAGRPGPPGGAAKRCGTRPICSRPRAASATPCESTAAPTRCASRAWTSTSA